MSLGALLAFYKANEAAILTILLILSEFLGANPKVQANGILSFILQQVRKKAIDGGAKDPTP
jgi:hypothetical protein